MKIPIPTSVVTNVNQHLLTSFPTLTEKQKLKLFQRLIELWFYVKQAHVSDVQHLESREPHITGSSHLKLTNINRSNLQTFQIRIGKSVLTYKWLIDQLIAANCLERNPKYSTGRFSQSYRPHPILKMDCFLPIELDIERIFARAHTREQLYEANPHRYRKLIDDMYTVTIDLESLFAFLDTNIGFPYSKKTDAPLTPAKAYSLKIQAIKINLGCHFFSVASTGRIYSSIANLPTCILDFIRLNNNPIVEIDAVNSQPLLLAALVDNPTFKSDVEAGCFYEKMAQSMGITRQEFKLKSYRWIFFNEQLIGSIWQSRLDAVYPGLTAQINAIKEQQPLWFALQSSEAAIWVTVAQRIIAPVLTRHDSMLVTPTSVTEVIKQIKREYQKIGLSVSLKTVNFDK